MKKNHLCILVILFFTVNHTVYASDTVRVMQYNLLHYGYFEAWTGCTTENNGLTAKNAYLKTIVDYAMPDILGVNELDASDSDADEILNKVLNTSGRRYFKRSNLTGVGQSTVNMLYYDSRKFILQKQEIVPSYPRVVDIYTLYYNSPDIAQGDTVWLTCLVAHLKAGSYPENEVSRNEAIQSVLAYLFNKKQVGNYLLMGDFNTYSVQEPVMQTLANYTEPEFRFYDPIDKPGAWNNNSDFAAIHTQSTNYSSNGCSSGGGMDDRFDFILTSDDVRTGQKRIQALPDTYHALGQDGQHFNGSVNYGFNQAVPVAVANALYGMSDHLPVLLNLVIDQQAVYTHTAYKEQDAPLIWLGNRQLHVPYLLHDKTTVTVYSLTGQQLLSVNSTGNETISLNNLPDGIYLVQMVSGNSVFRQTISLF